MITRRTLALSLTIVGLALAVAGPFLPGGRHLVAQDPPGAGHLTSLTATRQGDILVGTQAGAIWRLHDHTWTRERMYLGDQPVMAMIGEPGRTPVGTAGGLYFAPVGASPLEERVGSLLQSSKGLIAGTAHGVRWLANGAWQTPGPPANVYCLLEQRAGGRDWLYAGTIDAGVLTAPATELGRPWQPNSEGLPSDVKVLSLASAGEGLLLAGTDQGLFWQSAPGQTWQALDADLAGRRVLALHLADAPASGGPRRLWIGTDEGLYWLDLVVRDAALATAGRLTPAEDAANQPALGISWIVEARGRLMISAGSLYEYRQVQMAGWYWVSILGVALVVLAGVLMPRPQAEPPAGRGA